MTCIAAFIEGERVWMGGDSAAVSSNTWDLSINPDPKVFRNGDFIFGTCGSQRMRQILHYVFEPPKVPVDCMDLDRFMVAQFINSMRNCFRSQGYLSYDDGEERGGTPFLVAWRNYLWCVENPMNLYRDAAGIMGIGSGGALAQGALEVLNYNSPAMAPDERLKRALAIAEARNAAVRRPFHVIHT